MVKTFCDNCKKELKEGSGYIFGYDSCPKNKICIAELTLRASRERYRYSSSKDIPTNKQIKETKKILEKYVNKN
jgi:hypothetical protein